MDIPHSLFEEKLEKLKNSKGVKLDTDLTATDLKNLVEQYKNVYFEAKGEKFPSGSECNTINFFLFCCYSCEEVKRKCSSSLLNYQLQIQRSS